MDAERWQRIDNLLQAAWERPPAERAEFLRQACAGDQALKREIGSLIASDQEAGSFLEGPALAMMAAERRRQIADTDPEIRREVEELRAEESLDPDSGGKLADRLAAKLLEETTITQLAGQTVSHYKILEMLGAGGMGVVYKAFDTKLGRHVALKFLPPHLRHNDDLKRRLNEEARAASSLDHPNIVVIHDIDEAPGGELFIAMAFHEGVTLRERIERAKPGGLLVAEALQIARQIASGLAKAHERGIIHRDIKPGNVIVAKDGVARIIDFGLAKSTEATATLDGSTKGTPLYMSPEQVSGKALDCRTDLWSLGAVLYEMLTGRPPFTGDGHLPVMHAIVHDDPPRLRAVRPDLPLEIDRIVSRALEKDPPKRYQSAGEMVRDLSAALTALDAAALDAPARKSTSWRAAYAVPAKAVALAAAAVAVLAAGYFYFHRAFFGGPKLTDKDTIVLADFENKTGDPVFDGTLRQGLAIQLEQSPFLSLISDERVQQVLGLMGQPADARLTSKVAQEICERTGSAAVLEGSISKLGNPYVLWLRAKNCGTGAVLDEEQVEASGKGDVLKALSQIASKFRTRVGESLATVKQHSTPLEEATTSSLEALKAYSEGWKVLASAGPPASQPHFKRATEIDPQFAMAYANLGVSYSASGQSDLSVENIGKAYKLRDRVSDAEKFFISASYDMQVTGNMEKEQQTCEAWAQTYPRDATPHGFLGGGIYPVLGKYQKALEQSKRAVELMPDFALHYNILAFSYVELDRLGEATNTLQRAAGRKLEAPDLFAGGYEIAFLKGDQAGMEKAVALSQGKFGAEDWITDLEAFVLAYSGQLQKAIRKAQRAAVLAQQSGQRERAALYQNGAALWEAFFGNAPAARLSAAAALDLAKSREVDYGAAFALALAGDSSQPQTLASDLEKRFPEDTCVRFSYLPALRAVLALKHGEPLKAIEQLQIAAPYELGAPQSSFFGSYGAMYPVYVRGEAYLAASHYPEAAAEFQKILAHRGVVLVDPIGALARWRLGRAFALSGDTARAKTAYQDFLTLWKDADLDIPIFKQAKAEYAKL